MLPLLLLKLADMSSPISSFNSEEDMLKADDLKSSLMDSFILLVDAPIDSLIDSFIILD